jgi:LemA protein
MNEMTLYIGTPLAVLAAWVIATFNRLILRRNACSNARASIDVNLTRRHDLIPNLVEAIKGYTQHEQETLTSVIAARQKAVDHLGVVGSATAEDAIDRSLSRLLMLVEDYPDLKADSLFDKLMRNLTEAEEQISASRRAFNAQVMRYNNLVESFPSLIVARVTMFGVLASYSAAADARAAPSIRFDDSKQGDG